MGGKPDRASHPRGARAIEETDPMVLFGVFSLSGFG
jgi:hypothetical protein